MERTRREKKIQENAEEIPVYVGNRKVTDIQKDKDI
jgi:hypothetical protein